MTGKDARRDGAASYGLSKLLMVGIDISMLGIPLYEP